MEFATNTVETECFLEARKEVIERYLGRKCTDKGVEEYMPTSALEVEVECMHTKERLALDLQRRNEWRMFLGHQPKKENLPRNPKAEKLNMDRKANVITLTGLKIFPKVGEQGGEATAGTLEVHAYGFVYQTSSPFCVMYKDVKKAFFQVQDKKKPPLLHFHLHYPIRVGRENRRNIQFHLVQTPVRHKRSYDGSDKIEKEKKTMGKARYEDLENFVLKVQKKWEYIFVLSELHMKDEFQGDLPSKPATTFNLTFPALVGLEDEPFVVGDLDEIEIVYLRIKPELIDMTIVFQDLERDLVQINSIPIDALVRLKDRFNFAHVKYYEISVDLDWGSIVKEVADSKRNIFVDRQGKLYDLENFKAANYCPEVYFANQMMKVN